MSLSRSYKKHPYGGDSKRNKRIANHTVRQKTKSIDYILNRSEYKKLYERWDICDYFSRCTFEEYWDVTIRSWERWGHKYYDRPNIKEEYKNWCKYYRRK